MLKITLEAFNHKLRRSWLTRVKSDKDLFADPDVNWCSRSCIMSIMNTKACEFVRIVSDFLFLLQGNHWFRSEGSEDDITAVMA